MIRTGLVGRAILASRSPWLHEQEARAQGLALDYDLFDFDARGLADAALGPLLRRLAATGYSGVNVTYPFKQAVIPLLDALDESAASVGAVNTVAMREGRLIGHNTDMSGFADSFAAGLAGGKRDAVLQFGAGGAGAAVAHALLGAGVARLAIADSDRARVGELVAVLAARHGAGRATAVALPVVDLAGFDGVVNATPMGMAKCPGAPLDTALLAPRHWVADIVYFPLETELLRAARARGCATLDGSGMVIGQAAAAFAVFTGHRADTVRMRASFAAG